MKISNAARVFKSDPYLTFELLLLTSACFYFMPLKSQVLFAALLDVPCCFRTMCFHSCCFLYLAWYSHPFFPLNIFQNPIHFATSRKHSLMLSPFFPIPETYFHYFTHLTWLQWFVYPAVFPTWLWAYLWYWSYSILVSQYVVGDQKNARGIDWIPVLEISQMTLRSLSI